MDISDRQSIKTHEKTAPEADESTVSHQSLPHLPDEIWCKIIRGALRAENGYLITEREDKVGVIATRLDGRKDSKETESAHGQLLRVEKRLFLTEGRKALYDSESHWAFDDVETLVTFLDHIRPEDKQTVRSVEIPETASMYLLHIFRAGELPNLHTVRIYDNSTTRQAFKGMKIWIGHLETGLLRRFLVHTSICSRVEVALQYHFHVETSAEDSCKHRSYLEDYMEIMNVRKTQIWQNLLMFSGGMNMIDELGRNGRLV